MTPERHAQIKAIFTEAMSCAPNDRSALLERRCAGDESLRSEVERLLGLASDLKAVRPEEAVTDPVPPHSDREAGRTPDPAGPSPSQKPPPLETGTILAERFRIVAWLGSGAMGAVYRAEDLVLHQTVALKFLDPTLAANPRWLARFRHEARLAREITHPNVCRTFDIGEADGAQFLTMEYVDGENLASLLKRIGRVPSEKGVEIGRQI